MFLVFSNHISMLPQSKVQKFKAESKEIRAPKRERLFLNFSLLSFAAFVLIGYVVVSAIRPAILNFIVSRQESDTVVFVNRLANNLLQAGDFNQPFPLPPETEARLAVFVEGLQVPARLAVFVTNKDGLILSSDFPETAGSILQRTPEFERASRDRRSVAIFTKIEPEEKEMLGVEDAFELFIPITFGASPEVAGVVHTISRTGFIFETARTIERDVALRISAGLLFLYFALSIIVWGASRTIRAQATSLHEYATTLEVKVKERTRDLEESTKREISALKEVSRLKDEFVFIATHELRSPVTAMRWNLDIVRRDKKLTAALPEILRDSLAVITSSVERLHILISDLLDVARLESGAVRIERLHLAAGEIIISVTDEYASFAQEKKVTIFLDRAAMRTLPQVEGDAARLREVFNNLLTNAIKFNKSGGQIKWEAGVRNSFLEVSLRDTGLGVKKEHLPQIFTKFFRGHEQIEGTGLGLWISHEIMKRMGGEILVASEEGKGSVFTVRVPLAS